MREFLFKGKTKAIAGSPYNNGKPDGEWVKGYLYNDVGCWKIRQFETNYADYIPYEVDPETIGQYIGVPDKDGTKVFEGDILESAYDIEYPEDICLELIVWYQNGWCTKQGDAIPDSIIDEVLKYSRVIGNIHDHPELLGGFENATDRC